MLCKTRKEVEKGNREWRLHARPETLEWMLIWFNQSWCAASCRRRFIKYNSAWELETTKEDRQLTAFWLWPQPGSLFFLPKAHVHFFVHYCRCLFCFFFFFLEAYFHRLYGSGFSFVLCVCIVWSFLNLLIAIFSIHVLQEWIEKIARKKCDVIHAISLCTSLLCVVHSPAKGLKCGQFEILSYKNLKSTL